MKDNKKLKEKFISHIKHSGLKYNWWTKKYFPNSEHSYIYGQITGHFKLMDNVRDAMEKYLNGLGK